MNTSWRRLAWIGTLFGFLLLSACSGKLPDVSEHQLSTETSHEFFLQIPGRETIAREYIHFQNKELVTILSFTNGKPYAFRRNTDSKWSIDKTGDGSFTTSSANDMGKIDFAAYGFEVKPSPPEVVLPVIAAYNFQEYGMADNLEQMPGAETIVAKYDNNGEGLQLWSLGGGETYAYALLKDNNQAPRVYIDPDRSGVFKPSTPELLSQIDLAAYGRKAD